MAWWNIGDWDGMTSGIASQDAVPHMLADLWNATYERSSYNGLAAPYPDPFDWTDYQDKAFEDFGTVLPSNHITTLRTSIEALFQMYNNIPRVAPSPLWDTVWADLGEFVAEGGYGTSWLTPIRVQDKRVWLQMRGVLEACHYFSWPVYAELVPPGATFTQVSRRDGGDFPDYETGWDAMVAAAPAPDLPGTGYVSPIAFSATRQDIPPPTVWVCAGAIRDLTYEYDTTAVRGTIVRSRRTYRTLCLSGYGYPSFPTTLDIPFYDSAGAAFTHPSGSTDKVEHTIDSDAWLLTKEVHELTVGVSTPPVDVPWAADPAYIRGSVCTGAEPGAGTDRYSHPLVLVMTLASPDFTYG